MMKGLTTISLAIALLLLIGSGSPVAYGQEELDHPATIVCPADGYVNDWSSNFCINDGFSLVEAKRKVLESIRAARAATQLIRPTGGPATLEVGMSRIFHLRDGNIVSGTIVEVEGDSIALIETPDGALRVPAIEILEEMVDLVKQDGSQFTGPLLSEDEISVSIKTPYGVAVVLKRDIRTMDRYYGDKKVTWAEEKRRFFAAEEMTDIFLDPTAFPLRANVVYLSGFSVGYGFTENFMLRTEFGRDFVGDLNLHPLFRLVHRVTGTSELGLALGFKFYNRHKMKSEWQRYSHWITQPDPNDSTRTLRLDEKGADPIDTAIEDLNVDFGGDADKKEVFGASYLVLSRRSSLASGRGKWGWHLGAATNSLIFGKPELSDVYEWDDSFKFPYRIWVAMDYDLTKRLKFLIDVWADNGHKFITLTESIKSYFDFDETPFTVETQEGDYRPFDFDFGFTYAVNDALRLGVHFQAPYLTVYWKFYQL